MTTTSQESPDNASVLQDKDIDRLVNAQKKPTVDANLPLKDKVDRMKSARRQEADKLTGGVGVNPFDSLYPKGDVKKGVATTANNHNNVNHNHKTTSNHTTGKPGATPKPPIPKAKAASPAAFDTATFMTGNTSAAID